MSRPVKTDIVTIARDAAKRLAARLARREAVVADLAACSDTVPTWWREGIATAAVFGDNILCLPSQTRNAFSRPITFLTASEISNYAGGEFLPLAWVAGSTQIALVQDAGERPVVLADPKELSDAERVSDSIAGFLDALQPQTLCQFRGPDEQRTIEIHGDTSLLVERGGETQLLEFPSDDELGEYVASFIAESLDAKLKVAMCPAGMRRIIQAHLGEIPAAPPASPERRANAAIWVLLEDNQLEITRDGDTTATVEDPFYEELVEDLIDEAARFLEKHQNRRDLTASFADWLSQHRFVIDLYADDDAVRAALASPELAPQR